MADSDIETAWHLLEISGIVQSVLCALFGTALCHTTALMVLTAKRLRCLFHPLRPCALGKLWSSRHLITKAKNCHHCSVRLSRSVVWSCDTNEIVSRQIRRPVCAFHCPVTPVFSLSDYGPSLGRVLQVEYPAHSDRKVSVRLLCSYA